MPQVSVAESGDGPNLRITQGAAEIEFIAVDREIEDVFVAFVPGELKRFAARSGMTKIWS
jgi:hypothetical protein